jgi:hypothetical protein
VTYLSPIASHSTDRPSGLPAQTAERQHAIQNILALLAEKQISEVPKVTLLLLASAPPAAARKTNYPTRAVSPLLATSQAGKSDKAKMIHFNQGN